MEVRHPISYLQESQRDTRHLEWQLTLTEKIWGVFFTHYCNFLPQITVLIYKGQELFCYIPSFFNCTFPIMHSLQSFIKFLCASILVESHHFFPGPKKLIKEAVRQHEKDLLSLGAPTDCIHQIRFWRSKSKAQRLFNVLVQGTLSCFVNFTGFKMFSLSTWSFSRKNEHQGILVMNSGS